MQHVQPETAKIICEDSNGWRWEPSRLEQILAKYGQRWQIERDGLVWTATEHPSPTALHVIAHDLDVLEQKIIDSELPG